MGREGGKGEGGREGGRNRWGGGEEDEPIRICTSHKPDGSSNKQILGQLKRTNLSAAEALCTMVSMEILAT